MKKTVSLFLAVLISTASIAAYAESVNVYQCMFRCGYAGLTMEQCKHICGVSAP